VSRLAIIGDRDPANQTHLFTENALTQIARNVSVDWVPTVELETDDNRLSNYSGLLIAPGSPYRSMEGALRAIRFARENDVPLLGTCGGFQHVVIEFVRNVLGVTDADHEETNPAAPRLAISALECSLYGQEDAIELVPNTRVGALYPHRRVVESFFCSYGVNPEFAGSLEENGLTVSGTDDDGAVRILELATHPFFIATLFVPQARSSENQPHPLIKAFVSSSRAADN
jgi:CTP synthase (UTP-ammonia lyase)